MFKTEPRHLIRIEILLEWACGDFIAVPKAFGALSTERKIFDRLWMLRHIFYFEEKGTKQSLFGSFSYILFAGPNGHVDLVVIKVLMVMWTFESFFLVRFKDRNFSPHFSQGKFILFEYGRFWTQILSHNEAAENNTYRTES